MAEIWPATLAEALIRLQASLPRITKDDEAQVGTRTYRYANLASIHDAVLPLLESCGLYWTCCPTLLDGGFVLDYALTHTSGASISGQYPLPGGVTPQAMGGAITYARRYALCAVIGIAPAEDDDDGQAAENAARADADADRGTTWTPPANPRTRKATRHHGRDPHDPWATDPENAEKSSTAEQHRRLGILFSKIGVTDRADRLALSMSVLDLPELATSKDLSFTQAETLTRHLLKLSKETSGDSA